MSLRRLSIFAGSVAGLLASVAIAQVPPTDPLPPTDPPQTNIEDTRERYRASRAADKPQAETPADAVEVGAGEGIRAVEPLDPTLDPSTDEVTRPGTPQDPTLVRGPLPVGFERIEIARPVRTKMLPIVKDYDARTEAILARISDLRRQAISLEAVALLDRQEAVAPIVEAVPIEGRRATGFRPGDVPDGDAPEVVAPEVVIVEIDPDSPLASRSAAIREEIAALHAKAVRLEAEKLVALEGLLAAEQVERLRAVRVEILAAPPVEVVPVRPVVPSRPAVPVRPAVPIERKVEIDDDGFEIEERLRTPDGGEIEIKRTEEGVEIERDE